GGHMAFHSVDVVRMETGVDHRLHRLVGDLAELRGDLPRRLDLVSGVDDDHTTIAHHHDRVAYRPTDSHIHVVPDLPDPPLEERAMGLESGIDLRSDDMAPGRWRDGGTTTPERLPAPRREQGTCHADRAIAQEPAPVEHRHPSPR